VCVCVCVCVCVGVCVGVCVVCVVCCVLCVVCRVSCVVCCVCCVCVCVVCVGCVCVCCVCVCFKWQHFWPAIGEVRCGELDFRVCILYSDYSGFATAALISRYTFYCTLAKNGPAQRNVFFVGTLEYSLVSNACWRQHVSYCSCLGCPTRPLNLARQETVHEFTSNYIFMHVRIDTYKFIFLKTSFEPGAARTIAWIRIEFTFKLYFC